MKQYKEKMMEIKKKIEKQLPIKQKQMQEIAERYKKIIQEKADQIKTDAGKYKADIEQLKAAMEVVSKIVTDLQKPGALDQIQADIMAKAQADATAAATSGGNPAEAFDQDKLKMMAAKEFLKPYTPDILKAFPKMGKGIINAETDEERQDILEDAMESRLNKFALEFEKQSKLLVEEINVYKKDLLKELDKIMQDLYEIVIDVPMIGEQIVDQAKTIWAECKSKVNEQEVPEIPNPVEMIQEKLKGGGAGGIIETIKGMLGMGAKKPAENQVAPAAEAAAAPADGEGKKKKKKKKKDAE